MLSYQSDFQKVVDFNTQFGVHLHTTPQYDIFDKEPQNVEFCLKLIREEMRELHEAIQNNDFIETIDALADILYVVYGMGARIGMNMDHAFHMSLISSQNLKNLLDSLKGCYDLSYSFNDVTPITMDNVFKRVVKKLEYDDYFTFKKVNQMSFSKKLDTIMINTLLQILEESVINKNYTLVILGLCDLLYACYTMSAMLGTDMNDAFDLVHQNNMSKLCQSGEEAIDTVIYYKRHHPEYDSPACRLAPDEHHWVVFNESTKKILKSIKWKPVDLTMLYK